MELRQTQKQVQQLALTQTMRQSLQILQMPILDLREYLEQAAAENPLLEVECPAGNVSLQGEAEEPELSDNPNNPEDFYQAVGSWRRERPRRSEEDGFFDVGQMADARTTEEKLEDVLNEQLLCLHLPKETEELCRYLIACLDHNGYLNFDLTELAFEMGCSLFDAEQALYYLQSLQPAGIGARNLQECLILQLAQGPNFNAHTLKLVQEGLPLLAKRDIAGLEKLLGLDKKGVLRAAEAVAALEPLPGRGYAGGSSVHYIMPDVLVHKVQGQLVAEFNSDYEPIVRLDEESVRLLKQAGDKTSLEYLKDKKAQADTILQSLKKRGSTMSALMRVVLDKQSEYFLHKAPLEPMTMEQVAEEMGVNVSTVSRAVQGRYLSFGGEIIRLRSLFSAALPTEGGDGAVTQAAVKLQLAALIREEDHAHPFSDDELSSALAGKGMAISRRTVAKYREELEIPSSAGRKRRYLMDSAEK